MEKHDESGTAKEDGELSEDDDGPDDVYIVDVSDATLRSKKEASQPNSNLSRNDSTAYKENRGSQNMPNEHSQSQRSRNNQRQRRREDRQGYGDSGNYRHDHRQSSTSSAGEKRLRSVVSKRPVSPTNDRYRSSVRHSADLPRNEIPPRVRAHRERFPELYNKNNVTDGGALSGSHSQSNPLPFSDGHATNTQESKKQANNASSFQGKATCDVSLPSGAANNTNKPSELGGNISEPQKLSENLPGVVLGEFVQPQSPSGNVDDPDYIDLLLEYKRIQKDLDKIKEEERAATHSQLETELDSKGVSTKSVPLEDKTNINPHDSAEADNYTQEESQTTSTLAEDDEPDLGILELRLAALASAAKANRQQVEADIAQSAASGERSDEPVDNHRRNASGGRQRDDRGVPSSLPRKRSWSYYQDRSRHQSGSNSSSATSPLKRRRLQTDRRQRSLNDRGYRDDDRRRRGGDRRRREDDRKYEEYRRKKKKVPTATLR